MKVTISVPDELIETLQSYVVRGKSLETVISGIVQAFPVDLREPYLLINNDERKEIQRLLDVPIPTTKELLRRIATHASLTLGNIRVQANTAQMAKLAERAKANGCDPQEYAEVIFGQMAKQYFGHV